MGKVLFVTRKDGMNKSIDKKISDALDCEFVDFGYVNLIETMTKGDYAMVVLYISRISAEEDIVLSQVLAFSSGVPLVIVGEKSELKRCYARQNKDVIRYIMTPILFSDYLKEIKNLLKKIAILNGEEAPVELEEKVLESDKASLKKILVVDDDIIFLRTITNWLKEFFSITVAKSGADAIRLLSKDIPDLILMDYEMPVCDGLQTVKMLRAEENFKDIPVFFLTGVDDSELVKKAIEVKPQGYILKSQGADYLVSKIEHFF